MRGYVTIEEGCVASETTVAPLVSVIIPIYNTAQFLDQALASVEGQTLRNIEILCVNDGSTDGSLDIMREHAARDERIRIIDKTNGGYGSACNRGLAEARGTWIAIFEPDDWIDAGMYKDMVDYAKRFSERIDIVKTPYWRIWDPNNTRQIKMNCSYKGRIKPQSSPFKITDPGVVHILCHHPSIWSAIYRREFLSEHGISFHEIPGAGWADNPFLIDTLCQAENIVYLDKAYYNYREESDGQLARFAHSNTMIPFERWQDMTDCLDRLGVTDEGVWRAQNSRGFTYVSGIIEEVDLSHSEIYDAVIAMFARMDDDLVFSDPQIPPAWKQRYAELKGVEMPAVKHLVYAIGLVKEGAYCLRNTNLRYTKYATYNYFTKKKRREGRG